MYLLLITFLSAVVFPVPSVAEESVCLPSDGSCLANSGDENETISASGENPNAQPSRNTLSPPCRLYIADSNLGGLGLYSGVDVPEGDDVGQPDIVIPMIDPNVNEPRAWHEHFFNADLTPIVSFESDYNLHIFAPGLGWPMQCHREFRNVNHDAEVAHDSEGVHRQKDVSAGSFSYYHNFTKFASTNIRSGDELFLDCAGQESGRRQRRRPSPRSEEWLDENGICVDNLYSATSTFPGAGRGAFATRFLSKGSVVTPSPVIPMHIRDLEIMEQGIETEGEEQGRLLFRNKRRGHQLLQNYVFGDPSSDLVLLPAAPGVNFINHNRSRANVKIQWSSLADMDELLELPPHELLKTTDTLFIDYVALRNIVEGEELVLDYGEMWETLWSWYGHGPAAPNVYVSASEFEKFYGNESVRTMKEQLSNPYPENIVTACFWEQKLEDDETGWFKWRDEVHDCLRPCEIQGKYRSREDEMYRVRVWQMNEFHDSQFCRLNRNEAVVKDIPRRMIRFVDSPYSTDMHLRKAFRRGITAPAGMFPDNWMADYSPDREEDMGELEIDDLEPGEISLFRWEETSKIISENAFRIGLPAGLTRAVLSYCERMGIVEKSRSLVIEGNGLKQNGEDFLSFGGYNWYVIRPSPHYNSNMHWLSPDDEEAQEDFLRVLGDGGFDQVLESIGNHFELDGLFCYQLSLMIVSECNEGFVHVDFTETGEVTFNVIFPLILVEDSDPELLILDEDANTIGEYQFEFDIAAVMGDDAAHGTAANDYLDDGNMRLMMSVYITDVNQADIDQVMKWINQSFPRNDDAQYFYDNAGRHWKRDDPSKRLPRGQIVNDFVLRPLETNEIDPFRWVSTDEVLTEYAFRMGLQPEVSQSVHSYVDRMGITDMSRSLVVEGNGLESGGEELATFQGYNWFIQRTAAHYKSNMHWLSPNDEEAQVDFLRMLGSSGFDEVLSTIGIQFGLRYLQCYHLSFMIVSHCNKGFVHKDFTDPDGKVFNVIIPLILANDTKPELYVLDDDERSAKGGYKYEYGIAAVMGDETYHGTAEADYRFSGELRLMASVYIAEITEDNIDGLLETLTQPYPPSDPDYFFERQGIHWDSQDPSKRLPTY